MDNKELLRWFRKLSDGNVFDVQTQLKNKENKKLYRTSDFYKNTHYSIRRAYKYFIMCGFKSITDFLNSELIQEISKGNYTFLLMQLESLIQDFDVSAFENVTDYITEKLNNVDFSNLENKLKDGLKEIEKITKLYK